MDTGAGIVRSTVILLLFPAILSAAELQTEHLYRLADGEQHPEATLDDANWLIGSWTGTAFGKRFEEVWNPPSAGSMVGMFKLFGDDGVSMYELMVMTIEDGTLSLKIRHFSPDFTAWEDKTEDVTLRLVRKDDDALHFGIISFYRRSDDRIDAYVLFRKGDEVFEQQLVYERTRSP
jgi:hypothetical protein